MKDRIVTLCFREIKKSYKRFLSLLIMSFLGVAVFVGMRSTSKVMLVSLDKYYDDNNVYDVKIVSTLGLTDEDVEELKTLDLIDNAYGIHTKDVYIQNEDISYVMKLSAINENINKIILKKGNLPRNNKEIIVENYFLEHNNLKIGDTIKIKDQDNNIKNNELKIVGTVDSPLYLLVGSPALMRGTSNLGTGLVNFYGYANDDLFDMEYYSEIYLTIKDAKELITSEDDYNKLINYGLGEINAIKKYREKARYDEIYNRVMNEILEQEKEGQKQLNSADNQLNNYKKELDNGLNKLKINKNKLENGKKELNNSLIELQKAKKQIDSGYTQIFNAKNQLNNSKKEIEKELKKYNLTIEDIMSLIDLYNGKEVPRENLKKLVSNDNPYKEDIYIAIDYLYDNNYFKKINDYFITGLESIKKEIVNLIPKDLNNYEEIIKFINNININDVKDIVLKTIIDTDKVQELKKYIPTNLKKYNDIINFLDNYTNSVENIKKLFNGIISIKNAEIEINKNEKELNKANNDYNEAYKKYLKYKKELSLGEEELNKGYSTYYENLKNYNHSLEEFNNKKIDFEKKIAKAKEDINSLEMPTWYINTRIDNSDYSSYINIGGSINNLAKAFPTIFFIVAIFMSIMSMSRMALEDRTEIGSLKALGFSNINIMTKYITYSTIATIIGGILGSLFGFYFLTYFIWKMYRILYNVSVFKYHYDFIIIIIGILLSVLCITGTTILTVKNIIKENAASLLRPKAPPSGKNMFLEKTFIWKKINFSNKVTIRNIFRYRKRVIMTIIGIMGCTILLLTGYGIKDSIVNIPTKQFDEILVYDDLITYSSSYKFNEEILKNSHIKNKVNVKLLQANTGIQNISIVAVDNPETSNSIIKLKSVMDGKKIKLEDNVVVVSSKIAENNNLNIGDSIIVTDNDNNEYSLIINDIAENYVGHFVFMNKNTYEKHIGNYKINASYIKIDDVKNEEEVTTELMKNDNVAAIVSINYTKTSVSNMLESLDNVVLILIAFSGILSFVVLYNLSYINISERKREIASLKVLGFYNIEVDNYIIKENFFITIFGIIFGMLFGKLFVDFIVNSIEIDLVKFIHEITFASYLKTFMFMFGFTIIVCFIIHFTLKRINMIDSLKSVE